MPADSRQARSRKAALLCSSLKKFANHGGQEGSCGDGAAQPPTSGTAGPGVIKPLVTLEDTAGTGELGVRWKELAAHRLFRERIRFAWGADTLHIFASALAANATNKAKNRIDFAGYCKARDRVLCHQLSGHPDDLTEQTLRDSYVLGAPQLLPEHFLLCHRQMNSDGTVPIASLENLFRTKTMLYHTRIELAEAGQGRGYLTVDDVEEYIHRLVHAGSFPDTKNCLPDHLIDYYVVALTRKLFFYLDVSKRRRVKTPALMMSPFLAELVELQFGEYTAPETAWVSPVFQSCAHERFVYLANGKDHLVSEDLLQLRQFSPLFLSRVFEALGISVMRYTEYLDFLLVVEDMCGEAALPVLFRVLDIQGEGVVRPMIVHRFIQDIVTCQREIQEEESILLGELGGVCAIEEQAENLTTELYDLVHPKVPFSITLKDLLKCKSRYEFFSVLFFIQGFDAYEATQQCEGGEQMSAGEKDVVKPFCPP
eukprot:TRINITY_DN26730_c0_g1_i2.p1 TRINITY_DN26730_c0_g1~~TRINITY_DN26730_c0_g1_i2.p1  ORF type:complete len:483 (+),score=96.28 TRINITY_DN26730_c0_g1_i2:50-1498(+)